jgi:hypothetical protein
VLAALRALASYTTTGPAPLRALPKSGPISYPVTAPTDAHETSRAYLAMTPVA